TGEGGLVVLRDDDWADRMRLVRFHGIRTSAWERQAGGKSPLYAIEAPGLKYTMMDIQAAIGIHQLAKLDGFIARRTRLARRYRESFQDVEGVRLLGSVPYAYKHAWHLLVVEVDAGSLDIGRDEFLDILKQRNIGAGVHFPA